MWYINLSALHFSAFQCFTSRTLEIAILFTKDQNNIGFAEMYSEPNQTSVALMKLAVVALIKTNKLMS